jgi:hypothetical protein
LNSILKGLAKANELDRDGLDRVIGLVRQARNEFVLRLEQKD